MKIEMRFAHLKRILIGFDCVVHEVPRMNLFVCFGCHRSEPEAARIAGCATSRPPIS
jgi:hypothetical protein